MYFIDCIKSTIVAFSKQFTNILVERENGKSFTVDVIYSNKTKSYKKRNAKGEMVAMTLPFIAIDNPAINYVLDRQQNNFSFDGLKVKQSDNTLLQSIGSPSPVNFTFEVTIKTKYYYDYRYIIQQIIPEFQPTKYLKINLIPEMNITKNVAVKLVDISQNIDNDLTADADSSRSIEAVLTFEVQSYIFPPIRDRKIANRIKVYDERNLTVKTIYNEYSPDSIVNNDLSSIAGYSEDLILETNISSTTTDRYNYVKVIDFSTYLGTYGEDIRILDKDGNDLEFFFEYDNGELYSSDEFICPLRSLSKTGNLMIFVPFIEDGSTNIIRITTYRGKTYNLAENTLEQYESFNIRSFRNINIENKNSDDLVYIDQSTIYIRSGQTDFDDIVKVFPKNSIPEDVDKKFKTTLTSFQFEASKFLCGVTDELDNWYYIKCGTTDNDFDIYSYDGTTHTKLTTISLVGTLSSVTWDYDGTDMVVYLNSDDYTIAGSENIIVPFLSWNGTTVIRYDCFLGYKIL